METLVAELKNQYHTTLAMYEHVITNCTDAVWGKTFPGAEFSTFWREAYHIIFWIHNFLGDKDKAFHFQPFGADIDPRLFTPPNNMCERAAALEYAAQTQARIDEVFDAMTLDELSGPDHYDESDFRNVYQRLMYGLFHGQYHIGRLSAYLDQEGIEGSYWQG
ncbi:MAG: DinB family protein [Anaerolineae bacterium]|nr:DinB family protein [Anaerolineae bacterium]